MIIKFKLFENIDYIVGKLYKYNELSKEIQHDIDVQFYDWFEGNYVEDEQDPHNYIWEYKQLTPNDLEEYITRHFGHELGDVIDSDEMKKLIEDIRKNGIKQPAVGLEGNHRALACWELGIDLPYLEAKYNYDN